MLTRHYNFVLKMHFYRNSLLLLCLIGSFSSVASNPTVMSPLPSTVVEKWSDLQLVGQTSLRRFGFHVYDSSFWMIDKTNPTEQLSSATCVLSITYARKIRAQQLLSSTKKEWLRLGFADKYPLDAWLTILTQIWPDVDKGDQLIFVSTKDGENIFYNKHKRLGIIDDPNFGEAFLSIWLHKNARFSKNRKELLGEL